MNELMHKVEYVLCDWLLRVEHEVITQYFLCASNTRSTMECVCVSICDCVESMHNCGFCTHCPCLCF